MSEIETFSLEHFHECYFDSNNTVNIEFRKKKEYLFLFVKEMWQFMSSSFICEIPVIIFVKSKWESTVPTNNAITLLDLAENFSYITQDTAQGYH